METVMPRRIPARVLLLAATAVAAISALAFNAATAAAASEVVYSNVPNTLAGNYASVGPEAYFYAEFGGQMELAGTARNKPIVEAVMSSWGCQFGSWSSGTCETPKPKKKVKIPVTLKMYEVGEKNKVGEQLGEVTKTFAMPYRPSESPGKCASGRWFDEKEAVCYHGLAFKIKFPALKVLRMPKRLIIGLSYNTSDSGPNPIGPTECNTKSAGCFYDSLNIGLAEESEGLLAVGNDPTEPYINVRTPAAEEVCSPNEPDVGKFALTECPSFWENSQPLIKITGH
jgi:hypothetical protein